MERAFWATTSVGPYAARQVVVLDDGDPVAAGWIASGWLKEIHSPPVLIKVTEELIAQFAAEAERGYLPEQLTPKRRGRAARG